MGIRNAIANAGKKAGSAVSKLAALSPAELEEVQANREKYLMEMPDPKDGAAVEMTSRLLAASGVEIFNAYLPQLTELYVPVQTDAEYTSPFRPEYNIRYFNITKWVTDKKENNLEKLVNVYEVLSNEKCNIALIFNRKCDTTKVYLAVTNTQNADNSVEGNNYRERLANAIRGNFPGSEWKDGGNGIPPCFEDRIPYSVASASNIPTEKSEKFISQTIEKLLDGCVPENNNQEYTLILLATPILDIEERKLRLAEIYTALAPYASWTTDFHYSESDATNASATVGVNVGASAGLQNAQNNSVTNTKGVTDSTNDTRTDASSHSITDTVGTTVTDTNGTSISDSVADSVGKSVSESNAFGMNASGKISIEPVGVGADVTLGENYSKTIVQGKSMSESITHGTAETFSKSLAKSATKAVGNTLTDSITKGLGRAVSSTIATTEGVVKGTNFGVNFGANFARSSSVTATIGKNEGITQTYTNYTIKHALELLEQQMKRFEQSTALGMWDFAAYVISEDQNIANNVAHSYIALTQGEESYMSQAAINLWRGDMGENSADAKEICKYLKELRHPLFGLNPAVVDIAPTFNVYPAIVTATTSLSGKELAYSLNFPQKSVAGLPVIECTEFGRNIVTYDMKRDQDEQLRLGRIFHMNREEKVSVNITKASLASHTLVTGSTGSGKSNTVYQILSEAREHGGHFLVIEPAKGEYKTIFGMNDDVSVFGTNPELTPMLKINPFSFPKGIHILEHLDRLVEIFNVCWPMYAAMPAVLKSAVEKSYVDCGWNLTTSKNKYGEALFPTFADTAVNVKRIIESSEYDSENKGAYKGALLTRLQSLTNGINGMIFDQNEIRSDELFDRNVIIDLSRIGSSETKAMIMGMLVLKLQEYRMTATQSINIPFRHVTVLEEAHNLLRRTSSEQTSENANLLGKSVEMLANAIAEMRTYGEGFVIVDQAPGLLDMSTIRNTNTKIILRLPDFNDRELVGKAANLNDDQIKELAKLPCGVAAVYQNEWVQPVLCKVDRFDGGEKPYRFNINENDDIYGETGTAVLKETLLDCIMNKDILKEGDRADMRKLKDMVIQSKLDTAVKCEFMEYVKAEEDHAIEKLQDLIYDFLKAQEAIQASKEYTNAADWVHHVVENLSPSIKNYTKIQIDLVMALILYEQVERDASYTDLLSRFTEVYENEGGVF